MLASLDRVFAACRYVGWTGVGIIAMHDAGKLGSNVCCTCRYVGWTGVGIIAMHRGGGST